MSKLSEWSNTKYNVSFSSTGIAKELLPREIPSEVINVITAIEKIHPLENDYCV